MAKKQRKLIRRERRIALRVTEELFEAMNDRAYQENKTASGVMVEALIKHLNFKMPPRPDHHDKGQ